MLKISIWGGISSDIQSEIYIYGDADAEPLKGDFRQYIRRFYSPNENFEHGNTHSNALLQFRLKIRRCKLIKPHILQRNVT